jgi:uncharacterized protein (TIGR01777 family)
MEKQKVLIAGGSGLVGSFLADYLYERNYEVSILSRSVKKHERYTYHKWDLDKMEIGAEAVNANHIINLTGAGIADKRWTASRKKEIIESRVQAAQLLKKGLEKSNHKPTSYISASAIGIYGDRGNEQLTEESAIGESDFMVECCDLWEAEAKKLEGLSDQFSILRIGIVLSSKGGALAKFVLPLKLGQANYFGAGKNYYSWIHISDLSKIILAAIKGETSGIINAVSPTPHTNKEFMRACKKAIAPYALLYPVPAFTIKLALGEMSKVILNSNRVIPQKLMDDGFEFEFPELQKAVEDVMERKI